MRINVHRDVVPSSVMSIEGWRGGECWSPHPPLFLNWLGHLRSWIRADWCPLPGVGGREESMDGDICGRGEGGGTLMKLSEMVRAGGS